MQRMINFDCDGDRLVGTLDYAEGTTGLMIVSGGNEIRSGAYAGQAAMAQHFATSGCPVFRYDRRGVGDSEGENGGFEASAGDIAAAVTAFRNSAPHMRRLVAFGNCDAATAIACFHGGLAIDALVLANPWVIEPADDAGPASPPAAAIRARYLARMKNPRSIIDLLTGKIDLKKLAAGVAKAAQTEAPSGLAIRLCGALERVTVPVDILIAERDTTAMAFMAASKSRDTMSGVRIHKTDTASHSFADAASRDWLYRQIQDAMDQT